MPTFDVYGNSIGPSVVTGTTAGEAVGPSGPAFQRILIDDDDATYLRVLGGLGADQSWLVGFNTTVKDDDNAPPWLLMPSNADGITVALRARVRAAQTGCIPAGAYVEIYANDHLYGNLNLTEGFAWTSTDLPTPSSGDPWEPANVFTLSDSFGFRARTQCPSSVVQMGVDWAETALRVSFDLPAPTLTPLLPPQSNLPYKVVLRGILNPNQESFSPEPFNVAAYPIEYGFSVGINPLALPAITYTGTVSTGGTSNTLILSSPLDVLPGLIHYFRIGARDQDGNETLSTIASFQTPLTDPPQGVY